jgi:F0F1-type ATP synthase assembly protein I
LDNNPNKSDSPPPSERKPNNFTTQFGLAMELPFVLAGATIVGGLLGYFLDHWLHTKLIFTLVFGGLGFFAGLRDVLRRLPASGDGKG